MQLPAVITADLRLNEPRYATLPNIMKAGWGLACRRLQRNSLAKILPPIRLHTRYCTCLDQS